MATRPERDAALADSATRVSKATRIQMTDLAVNQRPMEAKQSRVLLIGAGATGLPVAAALLQADVALDIATRTRFEHLQVDGPNDLTVAYTVAVHTEAESVASYDGRFHDTVILATRTSQDKAVTEWLRSAVGPDTVVVALQSGVDHEDRLRSMVLPTTPIIPAVVYTHSERSEAGLAEVTGDIQIVIPHGAHSDEIQELFSGTFLEVQVTDNFRTIAWQKMVVNSSLGIMSVLTGKPPRAFADEGANSILLALLEEASAVACADGADLGDDFAQKLAEAIPRISPDNLPTIAIDRAAGRETEWQARNAAIVRIASSHGISVPLHNLGTTLIRVGEPGN